MLTQTKTAEPTIVNGINVDALLALIESVGGDAGKTHWRVTSLWQGPTRSRARVDGNRGDQSRPYDPRPVTARPPAKHELLQQSVDRTSPRSWLEPLQAPCNWSSSSIRFCSR
jgi:hypothetical protein